MRKMCLWGAMLTVTASSQALTFTMNFDTDASGNAISDLTTIENQYSAWGITFSPNHFTGGLWADDTDMRATSSSTGFGYEATMGNVLHSFDGWFNESGDPSIRMDIAGGALSVSTLIVGDESAATFMEAYAKETDGSYTLLGSVITPAVGNRTLTIGGFSRNIDRIGFAPGTFNDWVALDDITVTAVPEPASLATFAVALLMLRRKK